MLSILNSIGRGRCKEIATVMGVAPRTMSRYLKDLEEAGMVDSAYTCTFPTRRYYHLSNVGGDVVRVVIPLIDRLVNSKNEVADKVKEP